MDYVGWGEKQNRKDDKVTRLRMETRLRGLGDTNEATNKEDKTTVVLDIKSGSKRSPTSHLCG